MNLDKTTILHHWNKLRGVYSKLEAVLGKDLLQNIERQITLYQIDHCWAEHLPTESPSDWYRVGGRVR